tara:strand:+ start:190 stop:438 length:249 start_codon:yes stop_codon:yes gene_type:complete
MFSTICRFVSFPLGIPTGAAGTTCPNFLNTDTETRGARFDINRYELMELEAYFWIEESDKKSTIETDSALRARDASKVAPID